MHRRALLRRLGGLGLGVAGLAALRWQLSWPTPAVVFAQPGWSGWLDLPLPGGLIDLPAHVQGVAIRAVIDSGAEYSAIDTALAKRLVLPAATPIPMVAFGVSGGPSLTRAVRLDVDLDGFSLTGLRAATLSLHPLSKLTRQPFSLLLGRDFLRAVVLEADFPAGRAAVYARDAWRPPPEGRAVTARRKGEAVMVEIQVEEAPPVEVMLDTGATGALALSETAARTAGLMDGRPLQSGESVTLGGVSQDGVATARELTFAARRFTDVPVQIYRPAPHAPIPDGLLGLGVLARYRIALDVGGGRLFLIGEGRAPRWRPLRLERR